VPVLDEGGNPVTGVLVNNTSSTSEFTSLGIAEKLGEFATLTTGSVDGTLARKSRAIDTQMKAGQSRLTQFDIRLAAKRARLERQFAGMEQAIASLQSQSGALGSISTIR
jgi:flagellar capping protein FliD